MKARSTFNSKITNIFLVVLKYRIKLRWSSSLSTVGTTSYYCSTSGVTTANISIVENQKKGIALFHFATLFVVFLFHCRTWERNLPL